MKKTASDRIVVNSSKCDQTHFRLIRDLAIVAAGLVIVAGISFLPIRPSEAVQLGSPPFSNPAEVRSRPSEKRLRAIMEIINGEYLIPNVGREQMRQYRGWDAAQPRPSPGTSVAPGPTLRVRLGDQVQIAFLNKADESQFPYSFVTGNDKPPFSDFGCDRVGLPDPNGKFPYPASDIYPNCFHGSSTANIHFHGTHTSPDGLGDNVLVQVLPDPTQPDFTAFFNQIYSSRQIPQKWEDLPEGFRTAQLNLVAEHDTKAAADAAKNGLKPPEPLLKKNKERIALGLWPQYFIGAFPNFFDVPDYSSGKFKAGQSPGTHWYHAHKHGSTSLHIRNGLAGALVIESSQEGGYDHFIRKFYGWGDSYGTHEKIFVLQQYDPTQNLERAPRGTGIGSGQVLVNGSFTPTITMRPGEVQLWRFVNATQGSGNGGVIKAGTIKDGVFGAPTFKFVQTAQDGVQFSPTNYTSQPYLNGVVSTGGLVLAAGNRADLLVKAPNQTGTVPFKSNGTTLFFVNVVGTAANDMFFPTTWAEMPKFLLDLPMPNPYDPTSQNPGSPVKFQWEAGRTKPGPRPDPPHFMINNKQFGETGDIVDQCMPLNGLQDWVLENYTTAIAHPFHIHINPFQIIQIDTPTGPNTYSQYTPKNNYIWQDVIAIPPAKIDGTQITPGRVTIRQTYPDFAGTFVLHCHILAHEDRGMMQLVRIVPRGNYPTKCQDHPPEHH